MLGKILIGISGALLLATVGLVIVQKSSPQELPTSPGNTPISWASNQLDVVMFPGTSTTTKVSFRSSQALTDLNVSLNPPLATIASATPKIFYSIEPNKVYTVTLTLKAPPEFTKRSYGGVLALTDAHGVVSQPLQVGAKMDWNDQNLSGIIVSFPKDWMTENISGSNSTIITNSLNPGPLTDASLQINSFIEISRLGSEAGRNDLSPANPNRMSVNKWFDTYFIEGFSVPPKSRTNYNIGGIEAVKIELDEVGGRRVHIYFPQGDNVIEISFGLFAPVFVPVYESILNGLHL